MTQTKENIMAGELAKVLKALLGENIVGFMEKEEENGFTYCLPGGKRFLITVKNV